MKFRILAALITALSLFCSVEAQTQLNGSLTNGLIAYYPLRGDTKDYSGNGNNGIIYGATLTNDQFGNSNQAYYFAPGQTAEFNINQLPQSNNPRTISFWMKMPPNGNGESIIGYGQSTLQGYFGSISYGNGYFGIYTSPNYTSGGPQPNDWNQVTITYDGNTVSMFLNGISYSNSEDFTSKGWTLNTIGKTLYIGKEGPYGWSILGSINNISIFNRAISTNEITQLYKLQSSNVWWETGFQYTSISNSTLILGYSGSNSIVTIPSTIGGLPVTSLGDNTFANQSVITSITIPNTVTNLGNSVFAGCSNLSSITLPDSVVTFGTNIFGNTPNVTLNASQSMISYLAQNASTLGFVSNSLINIQNGITASGAYNWIAGWLPSDSAFLRAVSVGLQIPSITTSLSNSISMLNATISNQINVLSNSLKSSSTQISSLSNTVSMLASNNNFIASLASNPAFLNALAAQITASTNNMGLALKLPQTLTISPIPALTYSNKKVISVSLKASSSANLTNTIFGIGDPSMGRIQSNTTLVVLGIGTTTLTATNSGNGIYFPASASQTLIVK